MTRKIPFSTVDPSLSSRYLESAARLKADAESMMELSDEFSGNGIALLCIHAAIAYGDAVAILAAGKKSKSGDHRDAGPFLESVYPARTAENRSALRAFQFILNRKDIVSYEGRIFGEEEAAAVLDRLRSLARWAEKAIEGIKSKM